MINRYCLASCALLGALSAVAQQRLIHVKVSLGDVSLNKVAFLIADDSGIYKKNGLEVEQTITPAAAEAVRRNGVTVPKRYIGASGQAQPPGTAYGTAESYLDNSFPNTSWDFSIYPEYKARTFRSLVSELTSIADPSEQPDLKEAILGYDKLLDLAFRANGAEDETTQAKSVIDLLERLTKHRWQSPESAQEVSN